jgi:hypothetical protein
MASSKVRQGGREGGREKCIVRVWAGVRLGTNGDDAVRRNRGGVTTRRKDGPAQLFDFQFLREKKW